MSSSSSSGVRRAVLRLRDRAAEGPAEEGFHGAYEAIGAQVAEHRARHRLSQRELAELCGTTQSAIARLEGGSRAARIDTLLRIAAALDCELVVQLRARTMPGRKEKRAEDPRRHRGPAGDQE